MRLETGSPFRKCCITEINQFIREEVRVPGSCTGVLATRGGPSRGTLDAPGGMQGVPINFDYSDA